MPSSELSPLPKCCDGHRDLTEFSEHLVEVFPRRSREEIVAEILAAERAATWVGLEDGDVLPTVEMMVWYRLSVADGRIGDHAKLDPQSHVRSPVILPEQKDGSPPSDAADRGAELVRTCC